MHASPRGATVYTSVKDQIKLVKGQNFFICSFGRTLSVWNEKLLLIPCEMAVFGGWIIRDVAMKIS
ncbi:hypothetical protein NC653_004812 [Populus alba x Populus x berolinensis]|uniref:Uncharacterized protein n=1 Tax=Populus alba x Populus x berolinensis TaxID=444605 RepID=A0AAD6WJR7_9ROSI|nr:hypothetical protein NC653_004812 [Populus alba x Populus x berolinensis]